MDLTAAPLTALAAALDVELTVAETAARLEIDTKVGYAEVAALDVATVLALADAYGDALHATIAEEGLAVDLTGADFAARRAHLDPDAPHRLNVLVDKRLLLERVLGHDDARATVLWFFSTSVAQALTDLDAFGHDVWGEDVDAGRVVLIGDVDLHHTGPLLTVASGARPPRPPVPERAVLDRIARMRTGNPDLDVDTRLTPEHLRLTGQLGDTAVARLLARAYVELFLRYTANRVRRTASGAWAAEFRGGDSRVVVELPAAPPAGAAAAASALRQVLDWCYLRDEDGGQDRTAQRLRFTQVEVAHRLLMVPAPGRLAALLDTASGLWDALDGDYRVFIEERITEYFAEQRELEDLVRGVVQKFGEQAAALTKSLSDAMLAAVAALIGSAIAAAFKDPFDTGLFRVGVLTYTAYLVLAPGLYGLSAQYGQFAALGRSFAHDVDRFTALLGARKMTELRAGDRVRQAQDRFRFWFRVTVAGFAAVAGVACALAWSVPSIVA